MTTQTPTHEPARPTSAEIGARVRHPLDAVRATIRRYVFSEAAASALLFIALWFWIGLAIDFGLFFATAIDWVLELDFLDPGGDASRGIRIGVFAILALGLAYLLFTKLFARLWGEFSDPAVALVLERRFPNELGDRLITAVELSDPKKAESYGFSGAMLAQTVNEAAERVERLPVANVFDWGRLRRLWNRAILATVGLLVVAIGLFLGARVARGQSASPIDAAWNFAHTASIWTERNVLFRNSYWLRNAQLEIVRFQDRGHKGEMRVGLSEQRPDLVVRSISWVVPDPNVIGGWRALKVEETKPFVNEAVRKKLDAIPVDWPGWVIDLDDLPSDIPTGAIPLTWQGKSAGEVAKEWAADPTLADAIAKAGAGESMKNLGNWRTWSFDKLLMQASRPEVADLLAKQYPESVAALEAMKQELETLAASASMNRRLRHLATPEAVQVVFRGATTKASVPGEIEPDQKFSFGLNDLKESVTFYVRGGDFFTPPLKITLSPPPAVRAIVLDKAEPAYLYHWLPSDPKISSARSGMVASALSYVPSPGLTSLSAPFVLAAIGKDVSPLWGRRQIFEGVKASVTGETTMIDVPLGSRLKLTAEVDRPLKDGIRISAAQQVREPGTIVPDARVTLRPGGTAFSVEFPEVVRAMDFQFEYFDEDNVKGKRRIRIRPIDDQAPDIRNFDLDVALRKPRFKEGLSRSLAGAAADGWLITPEAVLPFSGSVHDDVALTDVRWVFESQPIVVESAQGKDPGRVVLQGTPTLRRASLVASALQFVPTRGPGLLAAATYQNFVGRVIALDLKQKQSDPEKSASVARFVEALRGVRETNPDKAGEWLTRPPSAVKPFLKEHVLKRGEGNRDEFFVKSLLPDLKMKDPGSQSQIFYSLKLSLAATDNNVETGPSVSRTRQPVVFLVVPETVLLEQVALQEEVLKDRIEKVVQKLKNAQTTMTAQTTLLRSGTPETDFGIVALRVDEVKKAVLDGASESRDIHSQYAQILQELIVNRVKEGKINDVRTKIVRPLELIVMAEHGSFTLAEDVIQRLAGTLDDDLANDRVLKNRTKLLEMATQTDDQVAGIIRDLESILAAIDSGLTLNDIVQRAIALEQGQRQVIEPLRVYYDGVLRSLFDEILAEPKKK